MTRLVTCGWETGSPDENQTGAIDAAWIVGTASPSPKSPSVYWLGAVSGTPFKTWTFAAAKTDVYIRARVRWPSGFAANQEFMFLYDSAGISSSANVQAHLDFSITDNLIRLYRGVNQTNLLATSTLPASWDTWHLIEWRWQATSATAGICQVWLNGTQVINFSGDCIATANVNVQSFRLQGAGTSATTRVCFDDLAINDTVGTINNGQIGDGAIVLLKPTGAGTSTAQTRGGTDSGSNWDQVNEVPVSMTDYVFSATAATRDTYALQDLPAGSWTVNTVEVVAYAQNSDAGAGSLGLTVKSGATTNEGTAQSLGITPLFLRQQYELDPNTSAAWTNANVNALEAGTTVR